MRDLMFALAMLFAIPISLVRPINAYYFWGWTAALIPTSYFFGFMANARLNLVFALITISLVLMKRVSWKDYQKNRVTWLFLLFIFHAAISTAMGYSNNPLNLLYFENFAKLMAFCILMPLFIHGRLQMHVMLLVIVLGLGLHGVLDGLKTLASGGGHNMYGPVGSMIEDRNHLSTALALMLPLSYYLFFYTQHKLVSWGFLAVCLLVALAIMGGGSRGGFLALSIVSFWLIMTSRHKFFALFIVSLIGLLYYSFAPVHWTERLATIQEAGEDASFMGRVIAWKISSAIALHNPLFGGGFHAVQIQEVWDAFKTSPGLLGFVDTIVPTFRAKAAHSIYFEVLGDMGFVGFFIFMAILIHAIHSRFSIKRMANKLGASYDWSRDMADMLMLSIVAYMAGGAAVNLGYFEPIYMIIMLMEMLRVHLVKVTQSVVKNP